MITHSKSDRAHTHRIIRTTDTLIHSFALSLYLGLVTIYSTSLHLLRVFAAVVVVVEINAKRPLHTAHDAVSTTSHCLFVCLLVAAAQRAFIRCYFVQIFKLPNGNAHSGIVTNESAFKGKCKCKCKSRRWQPEHYSTFDWNVHFSFSLIICQVCVCCCLCTCLLFKRLFKLVSLLKYILFCVCIWAMSIHHPRSSQMPPHSPPICPLLNRQKQRKKDHDACTNQARDRERVWYKGSFDFSKLKWIHTQAANDMGYDQNSE